MQRARATGGPDGRLKGAKPIGLPAVIGGKVGTNDLDDLLRFSTTSRSSLSLELSNIAKKTNADVELYAFKRPIADVIKKIGKIDFRKLKAKDRRTNFQLISASKRAGNQTENIGLELDQGDYFVRVLQKKGNTKYTLSLRADPIVASPIPVPAPVPVPVPVPTPVPLPEIQFSKATAYQAGEGAGTSQAITLTRTGSTDAASQVQVKITGGTAKAGSDYKNSGFPLTVNFAAGQTKKTVAVPIIQDAAIEGTETITFSLASITNATIGTNKTATLKILDDDTFPTTEVKLGTPISSQIDGNVPTRRYAFKPTAAGDYLFDLTGLAADADIKLLKSDGTLVKSSTSTGQKDEKFIQPLDAGDYIVEVYRKSTGVATGFTLTADKLTDKISNSEATPTDITLSNSETIKSNYAVSNGKDSPVDYYRFTVASRSFLTVQMDGLFGNLDVALYKEGKTPADGLQSNRLGTDAEKFGGTLAAGSTYILKVTPGGTGQGSQYNLNLTLTPKSSVPTIIRDINFGSSGSNPANLTDVGGLAYFSADGEGTDKSLWVTDGTLDKTTKLKDFSGTLSKFTNVDGTLYFVADDGEHGSELWRSDGTTAGTKLVKDINLGTKDSNPDQLTTVGNRLYFLASDGTLGLQSELFRASIDAQGNDVVEKIQDPAQKLESFTAVNLTGIDNTLYFSASHVDLGDELWQIIDTPDTAGTPRVIDLALGEDSSTPGNFTKVGNSVFMSADVKIGVTSQRELIRLNNPTGASPTFDVFNMNGNINGGDPDNLVNVNGDLFFAAKGFDTNSNNVGKELWKLASAETTTTATAPTVVQDINAGSGGSTPHQIVFLGGYLFYLANDGTGESIWRTNVSNGTTLQFAPPNFPSLTGTTVSELTVVGNTLSFVATDSAKGRELWQTDVSGNAKIFDIQANGDSNPKNLINIGNQLFFVADDGVSGNEIWSL
jgi:ELWxxDGT repeat protein